MTPLAAARREAEEALATVAQRYPNGWGSYDTLSICTSALRALLAEPARESGSVSTVRSDDPPAAPLPTCANCGSNLITPAPASCDGHGEILTPDYWEWLIDNAYDEGNTPKLRAHDAALRAEIERLRDALRNISEETTDATAQEIADRALAPKEEQK